MTYAIIINIGTWMWNPNVVSWLNEKGCALVLCVVLWLTLKNTDYMDIIRHIEHRAYAHL